MDSIAGKMDAVTMSASAFQIGRALFPLLVTALLSPAAQQVPRPKQQAEVGQVTPQRDEEKEDQVATLTRDASEACFYLLRNDRSSVACSRT